MSCGSRIQQDAVDKIQHTQLQKPVAIRTIWGHRTISADTALLLAHVPPIPLITKAINICFKKQIYKEAVIKVAKTHESQRPIKSFGSGPD